MAKQSVCSPWNGKPGCGQPIEWRKIQQADGTIKNVMFNAGTQIMHLQACPARQNQPQFQAAPVQQGTFQPQQAVINPFAPAPAAAPQAPMAEQGPPESDPVVDAIEAGFAVLNTTMTNGLMAIHKDLKPDLNKPALLEDILAALSPKNQDSMLSVIAQNLGTLINLQKPADMLKDEPSASIPNPAAPEAQENPFEAPKKETKNK